MSNQNTTRKENGNAYEGKNRALDCDYVWYLVAIDKVPDLLLDGHTFIIVDGPHIVIRVSASQVLQIGRDKDAAPCAIVLRTKREVRICIFLLTACRDMLGLRRWWCRVFKFDNSLAYNWSETIKMNRFVLYCTRKPFPTLDGAR
jgi:hypothetical protein